MIISVGYLLARCLLDGLMVLTRRELSKDAELLVLRHEKAVLHRQISRVRYQPGDRLWLAALPRPIPRTPMGRGVRGDPSDAAGLAPRLVEHASGITRTGDVPDGPSTAAAISKLVIRIATDNPAWGTGACAALLVKLGHRIAACTVWQILHAAGWIPRPGTGQGAENPALSQGSHCGPGGRCVPGRPGVTTRLGWAETAFNPGRGWRFRSGPAGIDMAGTARTVPPRGGARCGRMGEARVPIGETLTVARQRAGLSVAQVSQRTRIRETIIRGIEDDDYSACGGDFYARGHIRAIAKVVGTDSEPLIRRV